MKQPHYTTSKSKAKASKADFDQALRHCESVATRVKAASEELSACWTALGIEIANGACPTQILRRRAWCNVLELRLKEKTANLEEARRGIDVVWTDLMKAAREREASRTQKSKVAVENLFAKSWSLLLQPKTLMKSKSQPVARAL
jgi:flagellar biosynthesis chaperone FliJ